MYKCERNLNSKTDYTTRSMDNSNNKDFLEKMILVKVHENRKLFEQIDIKIKDHELKFQKNLSNVKSFINDYSEKIKSIIDAEKQNLLDFIDEEEKFKTESWKKQSREVQKTLLELTMWEKKMVKISSLKELNAKLLNLLKKSEYLQIIEDCHVHFTPPNDKAYTLGEIAISPCLQYIEVDACEEAVANRFNTCFITVRDRLKRVVKNFNYMLTLYLVDRSDNPIYFIIRNLKNGSFKIDFYPLEKGKLYMYIMLDSLHINCSPKVISVKEAKTYQPVLVIGEAGKDNGQLCRPWGICCDSRGRIIVADRTNNRVQIFAASGQFLSKFGDEGSCPGEFNKPAGIAVDKYDRIIVADKDNHRIQIFDSEGNYIIHFGKSSTEEDSLNFPWDVAVNDLCNIAVTETKKRRIRLYSDSGIMLKEVYCTDHVNLDSPRGIACTDDGDFLITDFEKHKVIRMNENFEDVKYLGVKGTRPNEFNRPQGIALGKNNMFAVSDSKNHRIQIYKSDILYKIIGKFGCEPGEFDTPQGLAFHPNGNLIVVDFGNNKIQVFDIQ